MGIRIVQATVDSILMNSSRAYGVKLTNGEELRAEYTIVAAGAWTPSLVPQLSAGSNILKNILIFSRTEPIGTNYFPFCT